MLGDFRAGDVLDAFFNTAYGGTPTTLAGTPAIAVYKDNSLTQTTTGVSAIDVDHDGLTGWHHVRITTAADGTFYSEGSDFGLVLTSGTVGGVSVVGVEVERFSLAHRSALGVTLSAAGVRSAVGLAAANLDTQIAALFTTALTESYNADGSAPTVAQALFGILQRLTEFSISGTAITVKKLDGSTSAFVLTLDDATSPTSSTRSS